MPDEAVDFNAYRRAWRKANPEKVRAQAKRHRQKHPDVHKKHLSRHYQKNKEKYQTKQKAYYAANKDHYRDQMLRRNYGIGLAEYNEMYANQNGRCGCCNAPKPAGGKRGMAVDHNHSTNEIRSLLCMPCNIAIGHLGESALRAHAIADYLDRWNNVGNRSND